MLAAGAGTRLRPMTDVLPKPLAPVGGRPVVTRLLDQMDDAGFDAVALNVHHGADLIERVVGPRVEYVREPWLRGTAGALAGAAGFLADGPFVVASSDGVHEIDLRALVACHRESGAAATITVKRIARPETCAVVALGADRFVRRFVEKPPPKEVFSDLASIGVYCFERAVLELIPTDRPFDIAGELIPALLGAQMPVAAYETDAWWSDIGETAELLEANLREGFVADGCEVAPDAELETPLMIGPHSRVGARARVSGALVLPGASVGAGEVVEGVVHGSGDDVLRAWLR